MRGPIRSYRARIARVSESRADKHIAGLLITGEITPASHAVPRAFVSCGTTTPLRLVL